MAVEAIIKPVGDITKTAALEEACIIVSNVQESGKSALDALNFVMYYKEVFKQAEESLRKMAIDEANMTYRDAVINDKKFSHAGVEYKVSTKSTVDYSQDSEYAELDKQLQQAITEREELAKQACYDLDAAIIAAKSALQARKDMIDGMGLLPRQYEDKITCYMRK